MQQCAVIGFKLQQNANENCNSCASLAGLVLRPTLHMFPRYLQSLLMDFRQKPAMLRINSNERHCGLYNGKATNVATPSCYFNQLLQLK